MYSFPIKTGFVSIRRLSKNLETPVCLTRRLHSRVIKTAENIMGAHLQRMSDIDEVPAQDPKDSK